MGLFKLFSRNSAKTKEVASPAPRPFEPEVTMVFSGPTADGLVKLSGTTTFAKDAVTALLDRHARADRGMLVLAGALHPEPDNPSDSSAVAVHVEGERIGYLPGYVAQLVQLPGHSSRAVPVQFFYGKQANDGWRGEAWTWLSDGEPQWQYSENSPPPLTPAERRKAGAASTDRMIQDAVAGGGERAEQFKQGAVNGIHYLQTVEPIQELKRQGRLEDALALCYVAIEGAEKAREGREPAPWYTEQAAIIHRKLKQRDEEIAVLQRWMKVTPAERRTGSRIAERLSKLTGD